MTRNRDAYTFADTIIDVVHRHTHDGMVFHTSGKVTGMVDTDVDNFLVKANGGAPHFQRFRITAGRGDIDVQVYEDVVVSADGSALASNNTNRFSSNSAVMTLHSGPTITDDGTLIHTTWLPPTSTGVGQTASGLVGETNGEEWILHASKQYLVRLINNSGATIAYAYEMLWYEIGYPTL